MKSNRNLALIILCGLSISSCQKYETVPNDSLNASIVYDQLDKSANFALQARADIYSYLPDGFNRIDNVVLDAATDDAIASRYGNSIEVLSKSGITADINPDGVWSKYYAAIRKSNIFLSKIDQVPTDLNTIALWKSEIRFIRAISYFELLKRYSGVPLLGNHVYGLEDNLTNIPRNSYDEVAQYISKECEAIKSLLKTESEVSTAEFGAISRGTAYALKSRLLLYAASPLNNPSNDLTKWQAAADEAKALISLSGTGYALNPSFANAFLQRKNAEIILNYQRAQTTDLEKQNGPAGFTDPNGSNGYVSPTQNLVDAFPMKDGRAIGTSPAFAYDNQNPYINRDPRLALTVFYNGIDWLQRKVETFEGGLDKPNTIAFQTRTGYYMRKFLGNFETAQNYSAQTHNFPIFRYAEILLNYAEAINEVADNTTNRTEAFNQLKAIRARAGIAIGAVAGYNYGLKTNMTQVEMRDAIRNERRIEMAFEEQRFWDIRRWKTAESVDVGNGFARGVKITKSITGAFIYDYVNVDKLTFIAPKMYLYAIPLKDILADPALTQNPGY
jgi:hypothetical protein